MANGTPHGEVTPNFQKRISDLENKAQQQSQNFRQSSGTRPWHTPNDMADKNLLDVPNLHEPSWNRDRANIVYTENVLSLEPKNAGTAGDIASMKKQIDFMATEERAWRLRHASLVRCAALAHGRLAIHGKTNEGIFSMIKNVAENHIIGGTDRGPTGATA